MSKKISWKIEKRKLDQLNPYEHNPRKLTDKGMADLKRSIDKFGLAEPIIINQDNTIIGGHARYFTLLKMDNITSIDCYAPDRMLTPKEVQELNIRLNKNIAGEFDFDILANEFELPDLLEWEFEEKELDLNLWSDKTDEQLDDVPEPQKKAISKTGDIFLLDGKHRVMCGDSTKKKDVELLMDGNKAEILFCSPPYNLGLNAKLRGYNGDGDETIYNDKSDHKTQSDYFSFLKSFTENGLLFTENLFVNIQLLAGNKYALIDYLHEYKNRFVDLIVWDKVHAPPQLAERVLNSVYEFVIVLTSRKNVSRTISTGVSFRGTLNNLLTMKSTKDSSVKEHKAIYPVSFCIHFITNFSIENILDLFLGSGSTLIACEQTNRICYGMEIDPIYIDVILRRYYNLYPEKKIECLTRNDFNLSDLFNAKN